MHLLMPVMMILCDVACRLSIPSRAVNYDSGDFLVSGWNDIVRDKHLVATEAFLDWVSIGKPRQGSLYDIIKKPDRNSHLLFATVNSMKILYVLMH